MSEPKLLPCPFCGWEKINVLIDSMGRDDEGRPLRSIGAGLCPKCGARGPRKPAHSTDQGQVVDAWNRRADLGETVARAWAVANAAARDLAALRRAPTDAERAEMRDVIAAHERANERMRAEAKELTERLALVTRQRDEAEARAQAVVAQVAASTHGHSETPSGPRIGGWVRDPDGNVWRVHGSLTTGLDDHVRLWGYDAAGRCYSATSETLAPCEAPKPAVKDTDVGTMVATSPSGEVMAVVQRQVDALPEDRDEPRMRLPGEMWWRIHRSTSRVELLFAEPPNEPRCMGAIVPGPKDRWVWRGSPASIDEGAMRDVMRSVEEACGRGPLDEEVVP